jgi:glycosyltransferase involved in cell wall biosynthesis
MNGGRLLFLWPTLAVGGAERQLATLAPALRDRGFEPVVAAINKAGRYFDELRETGIPTHFVGMRSRYDLHAMRRVFDLRVPKPDVVFTTSVNAQVLGHVIARRSGAPHVTVEHGGAGLSLSRHRRALVRLIATRADAVVAVSETQIRALRAFGYRPDRIRVIPNGISRLRPTRTRADVRAQLGLAESHFVALLLASLRPEKRADIFVDAVAGAHREDPDVRGVVAGGGSELAATRARVEGVEAVSVLGEREDVADLISACDVVCLSSIAEGLPVAVIEAMSLARPVLASAVGGVTEAVSHGETGLLVEPGSPLPLARGLLELARDRSRAASMGLNGRERYEQRYTAGQMAAAYESLIRSLLANRDEGLRARP